MLKIVKQYIAGVRDIPFDLFYTDYILSVQDANLEQELKSVTLKNVILEPDMLDRLMSKTFGELRQLNDKR